MSDSLPIDEVVRRTGLTSRALRFYEARGLLRPLRTTAGRRIFGAGELLRIHQIVALKKAGLSLTQMKRLFEHRSIEIEPLLRAQRDVLQTQASDVAAALAHVDTALSRIDRGEPLDAATLCSLIRDGECIMTEETNAWNGVINRYYTHEEQAEWKKNMDGALEFDQQAYMDQWKSLSQRIESAMPIDPSSDMALQFVREWFQLLAPFSERATPHMWEKSREMYSDMESWEGQVDPGFSKRVWDFISEATSIARAGGNDIGPVPAFMK
jgi:MerR family transcriptional regulator, thiopeptide resistance regulator